MLLLQGDGDVDNTKQMDLAYDMLQQAGKVAEYRRYAHEDHSPDYWGSANWLDATHRIIEWLVQYLKPR